MCGIVGYYGSENAAPILLNGLEKLEYRGYDSAGIAVVDGGKLQLVRKKGRVSELFSARGIQGHLGIGHTRWATHGAPSEINAHPHVYGKFAVVHNGIIENEYSLKEECRARGDVFSSETDSEVIAHLLDFYYEGNLVTAVKDTVGRLKGSYALAVVCEECDCIVCVRKASPLVVGIGKNGVYAASDVSAIAAEGVTVYSLDDGELAVLSTEITFFNQNLVRIQKEKIEYDAEEEIPDLKGYRHFMRKEMAEIPQVLGKSIYDYTEETYREFYRILTQTEQIQIVACGTAYHSGLCAKYAIESLCRIPVEVCIASEYRYLDPIVRSGTLALAVSQSGETADTLAAAQLAKSKGAYLAAVTNVSYSSLTRIADAVLPTNAGREVAVAATKSFHAQLVLLYSLASALAKAKGREECLPYIYDLLDQVKCAEETCEEVRSWVPHFLGARSVFFLGRGADYASSLEGSLKLKEITYLPSEGYPAGELKHGTLALVDSSTPVVAVLTQKAFAEKTMNAVHEVYARGAKVFLITCFEEYCNRKEVTSSVLIPVCKEEFTPVLSVLPLQALAYYVSIARGNNPDKPRNLAKSVTVE